jgi:hypothetical protein
MDEIKGRAENTWGKVKDAGRNLKHDMERGADDQNRDIESDRKRDAA